ncbi:MAG: 50S ribosomal protein L24 [Candidatus Neomarinimicrobiota bacterium]|nr:50S ribosomal protein L24 [Candidatus Neomarinimicrobiota bacterium]RKY51276.1 MAG: 50S ribosomal protein L24 [Candidatus Neomarinimicrobiota bacterium]
MHVKKNDTVKVITGKDRGKTGKILKVFPVRNRVIVEGVNLVKRHTRPNQQNPQGGIVEKEAPIHVSNVMLMQDNQATRTGKRILADGSRVRYGKKTGEQVDEGK